MPNVSYIHPILRPFLKQYELIRDCIAGEQAVKHRKMKYLPMPNAEDLSKRNVARYDSYITRAVFYNVAQRTQGGLVGQIFLREPIVEVPTILQPVVDDATGGGVNLQQVASDVANHALAYGRHGIFIDFPYSEGPTSKADIAGGDVRPSFYSVKPWDIINWSVTRDGSELILNMVVFREEYFDQTDGFTVTVRERWRVLSLVNGSYQLDVYENRLGGQPTNTYIPKDAQGKSFDRLPFTFIGSDVNDATISYPPLYDLCAINIAHYRNSADYEESIYMLGQPQPWASGLTEDWVNNVFNGEVAFGAKSILLLPVDGAFGIAQVEPNTLAKEGMDQKEAQMLALGGKLVEGSQVQRTATEADIDNVSETSVLSRVAKNTAAGILFGLKWCAAFVGADDSNIAYDMNTEFDLVNLTPGERAQLLKEWQSGGIAWEEYRDNLRRAGVASLSDDDAKAKIAEEEAQRLQDAISAAVYTGIAGAPGTPPIPGATQPTPAPGAPGQPPAGPAPALPKPKPKAKS